MIDQLLTTSPPTLVTELQDALARGVDEASEAYYSTLIDLIDQGIHEKYRVLRMARQNICNCKSFMVSGIARLI